MAYISRTWAFSCASANVGKSEGSQEPRVVLEWASGNFLHSPNPLTAKFTKNKKTKNKKMLFPCRLLGLWMPVPELASTLKKAI